MDSSDSRLTPVLQKVELTTTEGILVNDTDWSAGQLTDRSNIFHRHSPRELVLANARSLDGQVKVEVQFYHEDDPNDPDDGRLHGEGGGWLRKMGDIMSTAAFNHFAGHLLMDYSRYMSDYSSLCGLHTIDESLGTIVQVQYHEGTVNGARASTQFEGCLVYWSHMASDLFRFTDPEFRAIPPRESLKWRLGQYDRYELPVEGDETVLLWTLVEG